MNVASSARFIGILAWFSLSSSVAFSSAKQATCVGGSNVVVYVNLLTPSKAEVRIDRSPDHVLELALGPYKFDTSNNDGNTVYNISTSIGDVTMSLNTEPLVGASSDYSGTASLQRTGEALICTGW